MFEKQEDELVRLGAQITTKEIYQQPESWQKTYDIYREQKDAISAHLAKAVKEAAGKQVQIIFTGAGTSAYVGDTLVPYLRAMGDSSLYEFSARATTDIVSAPYDFLRPDDPCVLVSFARSGNSPESLAAYERVGQVCKQVHYLNITCAPEGKLAVQSKNDPRAYTVLLPFANDQGFAMTGSFTCMELLACLVFDTTPEDKKAQFVKTTIAMGENTRSREDELASYLTCDFSRITYLGSGSLGALTREAQLKILELTAGKIATSFDTSMGYRHGPKSFVDEHTLVFDFVSNNAYTRQYDLDILHEIDGDSIAAHTVAIQQHASTMFEHESFSYDASFEALPEAYLALPYILAAQIIALNTSIKVGNTPDTPSPSGTVNRVVKGVTIHPLV
jgi:hypothetical protein